MIPTKNDVKCMIPSILRGTTIGSILGILPGGGAALAAVFGAYSVEKKSSKYSHEFGKGAIEGVAGPEAANNAAAQTSLIICSIAHIRYPTKCCDDLDGWRNDCSQHSTWPTSDN